MILTWTKVHMTYSLARIF